MMSSLKARILRNPLIRTVFARSPGAYLVGGYLRDLLARRTRSRDLDFVVARDLRGLVRSVSEALGGTVVEMRKEHMIRICLKDAVLDFSRLTQRIKEDLGGRDFTINAMAWSPTAGLIDPLDGYNDIKQGLIRGITKKNFVSDPLRLLRAYRFSGELSWPIEEATRLTIKSMPQAIKRSAPERITLEFFKLLNVEDPSKALLMAREDGLLSHIIPLSSARLERNIQLISHIRDNLKKLPERYHLKEFPQGLSHVGLVRLEQLLYGSEAGKRRLTLSRAIAGRVELAGRLYDRYQGLARLDRGEVFDLFRESGEALFDLLVLSGNTDNFRDAQRFLRIDKRAVLGAHEVMAITGLGPGRRLGRVLHELKREQFVGALRTKPQARRWLREMS